MCPNVDRLTVSIVALTFNIRSGSASLVFYWNYYLFMKWGEKCVDLRAKKGSIPRTKVISGQ